MISAYAVECDFAKPYSANSAIRSKICSRLRLVDAVLDRARDEALALLRHLVGLLLAHRAAQQIGFAETEAGELVGDLQHLVLVHDHAERLGGELLELGQQVVDLA